MKAKTTKTSAPATITLPPLKKGEHYAYKRNEHERGSPELVIVSSNGRFAFGKPEIPLDAVASALNSYFPPALAKDEFYAGIVIEDGNPRHHLILLPGELKPSPWATAGIWAKKQGGELPTRREHSLLFANVKEQFHDAWYWSSKNHASSPGYAWIQSFDYGGQHGYHTGTSYRARAVRRVTI